MKIASSAWLEIAHWENFLSFKTMKNSADLVLTMNSFYDKDDILQKNVKIPLKK